MGKRVITVRRRIIKKIIVLPDGTRKEVEEEVPVEHDDSDFDIIDDKIESSTEVIPSPMTIDDQQSMPDDDSDMRRVVTVRRRIIKKIIVLPDGTQKEIEEEIPVEDGFDIIDGHTESSTEEIIPSPVTVDDQQCAPDDDSLLRRVVTVR